MDGVPLKGMKSVGKLDKSTGYLIPWFFVCLFFIKNRPVSARGQVKKKHALVKTMSFT